jgi:hypothetical protein
VVCINMTPFVENFLAARDRPARRRQTRRLTRILVAEDVRPAELAW